MLADRAHCCFLLKKSDSHRKKVRLTKILIALSSYDSPCFINKKDFQ
jgi:hypothetical protein